MPHGCDSIGTLKAVEKVQIYFRSAHQPVSISKRAVDDIMSSGERMHTVYTAKEQTCPRAAESLVPAAHDGRADLPMRLSLSSADFPICGLAGHSKCANTL